MDIRFTTQPNKASKRKSKTASFTGGPCRKSQTGWESKTKAALRAEMASIRVRPDERSLDSAAICQQ